MHKDHGSLFVCELVCYPYSYELEIFLSRDMVRFTDIPSYNRHECVRVCVCVCVCVCALREVTGSDSTSRQILLLSLCLVTVGKREGAQ